MRSFFDFELAFDGIDEEGQLTASQGILLRGTLQLPDRELHTHLRQNLSRLLQANILWLLDHDDWPELIASPHPLRCGKVLCCIGS